MLSSTHKAYQNLESLCTELNVDTNLRTKISKCYENMTNIADHIKKMKDTNTESVQQQMHSVCCGL